jgi:hypothetical protein
MLNSYIVIHLIYITLQNRWHSHFTCVETRQGGLSNSPKVKQQAVRARIQTKQSGCTAHALNLGLLLPHDMQAGFLLLSVVKNVYSQLPSQTIQMIWILWHHPEYHHQEPSTSFPLSGCWPRPITVTELLHRLFNLVLVGHDIHSEHSVKWVVRRNLMTAQWSSLLLPQAFCQGYLGCLLSLVLGQGRLCDLGVFFCGCEYLSALLFWHLLWLQLWEGQDLPSSIVVPS